MPVTADQLVRALVKNLAHEWTPPADVSSETILDRVVRDHVREWLQEEAGIPSADIRRWVAGHEQLKANKPNWTGSKAYQVVTLWGAGKTSDLFIYHTDGDYGLPKTGISLEVKYVGRSKKTGKPQSYASAITTTAGQLLAYSIRHYWTIGLVWVDGPRRKPAQRNDGNRELCDELLKRLPENATLIVRFGGRRESL